MDRGLTFATKFEGEDLDACLAARARVENQILELAKVRGISVSVEVDSALVWTEGHRIQIRCGRATRTVAVDHETFVDEEFFRTLVLHQIAAVIDKLALGAHTD